jgi:phage shock protein PspC (stress-responsive transcriptional regulator)
MQNYTPPKNELLLLHEHKEDNKKLLRSNSDKILGGVCSGLAKYVKTDPILFRILFAAITLLGGLGIFIYITLLLVLEPDSFRTNEFYLLRKEKEKNLKVIIGSILILISSFEFLDFFTYFTGVNLYFFNNMFALSLVLIFLGIVIFTKRMNFNLVNVYPNQVFYRRKSGRVLLGVCSGFSDHFFFNINTIRMIWILFTFSTLGFGAIVYLLISLTSSYKEDN